MSFRPGPISRQKWTSRHHRNTAVYALLIKSSLCPEALRILRSLLQPQGPGTWCPSHVQPAWLSPAPSARREGTVMSLLTPCSKVCILVPAHLPGTSPTCLLTNSLPGGQCLEAQFVFSRCFLTSLGERMAKVSQTQRALWSPEPREAGRTLEPCLAIPVGHRLIPRTPAPMGASERSFSPSSHTLQSEGPAHNPKAQGTLLPDSLAFAALPKWKSFSPPLELLPTTDDPSAPECHPPHSHAITCP